MPGGEVLQGEVSRWTTSRPSPVRVCSPLGGTTERGSRWMSPSASRSAGREAGTTPSTLRACRFVRTRLLHRWREPISARK